MADVNKKVDIELLKYANRGYLSSIYVDNRYLLAEDLNKDNSFLLENNSKMMKAIYGKGEIMLYNPACFPMTGSVCTITGLKIFVDGLPMLIDDIILEGNGQVNLIVGIKEMTMNDKIFQNGKVRIEYIDYNGVILNEVELKNDIILKDPVFAESWTSNRQQLQYTIYLGETLENLTKEDEETGEIIHGLDIGAEGEITHPNLYCIPLFFKNGNILEFDKGGFEIQSDLGAKVTVMPLLKDLNVEFYDGYTNVNTLNVPNGVRNGIRKVNKYPTELGESILDIVYDTDINVEYYRTIKDSDTKPIFSAWERRLTTSDVISNDEVNSFLEELYREDVVMVVSDIYTRVQTPMKAYPIKKNSLNEVTLDFVPPAYDGYVFDSWNTDPNGKGKAYTKDSVISVTQGLSLYSIYRKK